MEQPRLQACLQRRTEIDNINEFEEIDCRHPEGRRGLELAGLLE